MTALQKLQDKALGNTKPVEIISALEACIVRSYSKHENKKGFYAKLDEKAAEELAALTARVKELEEALAPFTQIPVMNEKDSHPVNADGFILAYHVRKARAALRGEA